MTDTLATAAKFTAIAMAAAVFVIAGGLTLAEFGPAIYLSPGRP